MFLRPAQHLYGLFYVFLFLCTYPDIPENFKQHSPSLPKIVSFLEQISISCQYFNGCTNIPSIPGLPLEKKNKKKSHLYKLDFPDTPSYITVSYSPHRFCPIYVLTTPLSISLDAFLLQHITSMNVLVLFSKHSYKSVTG